MNLDDYGIECCNCNKIVTKPNTEVKNSVEYKKYIAARPGSYWVDTPDGIAKALCYPCSWNSEVSKQFPKLKFKRSAFKSRAVAYSDYSNVDRTEEIRLKRSISTGLLLLIIFVVSAVIGGFLTLNEPARVSTPTNNFDAEFQQENNDYQGNFDDQSKR